MTAQLTLELAWSPMSGGRLDPQLLHSPKPPPPIRAEEALIDRLRRAGLPGDLPITLHQNRRVMVSYSQARGLRVHAGYSSAPDEVISAIARWARPRAKGSDRRAAARVFLAFPVHGPHPPRPRRRPEPVEPGDQARLARLLALHEVLNARWFGGALSVIPIELSGRMRRKLGHYEPRLTGPSIALSRRHLRRDGWVGVAATLLHEMIHQWQDESGLPVDHGPAFRAKARDVGIEPRAVSRC